MPRGVTKKINKSVRVRLDSTSDSAFKRTLAAFAHSSHVARLVAFKVHRVCTTLPQEHGKMTPGEDELLFVKLISVVVLCS